MVSGEFSAESVIITILGLMYLTRKMDEKKAVLTKIDVGIEKKSRKKFQGKLILWIAIFFIIVVLFGP